MLKNSHRLRQCIRDILSVASIWEISIKMQQGLRLAGSTDEFIQDRLRILDVQSLKITAMHAFRTGALPPHHKDPFYRMIVAQALALGGDRDHDGLGDRGAIGAVHDRAGIPGLVRPGVTAPPLLPP